MKRSGSILAIASSGGHWQELRRLGPAFPEGTVWVSTDPDLAAEVGDSKFFAVPDANRWNKLALGWAAVRILLLVVRLRPTHVVTTGAAPGLIMVVFGRLFGAKTLWIDSVANAEELSLSGQKARRWASEVWTQWPSLVDNAGTTNSNIACNGSVL